MEHFFFPNSTGHQSCAQMQIIGGDADEDHTQIIGGMQSNYRGDISPQVSALLIKMMMYYA